MKEFITVFGQGSKMSNLKTTSKPLSFRFTREADDTERLLIYRLFEKKLPGKYDMMIDGLMQALTGFLSFVIVGPFILLALYGVRYFWGVNLVFEHIEIAALASWCLIYASYSWYKTFISPSGMAKQLQYLREDFKEKMIVEEAWRFVEAKAYYAPETGKRYYLVTADTGEKLFFHENILIGRERKPNESDFSVAPADMVITRGVKSGRFIRGFASGPSLPVSVHKTLQGEVLEHGAIVS
jgi:hypothetical protein